MAKKDNNKKEKKNNKTVKEGFIKGIKKELKLVKWPTLKDLLKYTVATIVFCIFFALFFMLLTFIMAEIRGAFN